MYNSMGVLREAEDAYSTVTLGSLSKFLSESVLPICWFFFVISCESLRLLLFFFTYVSYPGLGLVRTFNSLDFIFTNYGN